MPIAEGIAATKGTLDVSKLALDLLRRPKIDGEEVRNKLIEMQDLIFSAQRALGDAEQENRDLRRQLEDQREWLTLARTLLSAKDCIGETNIPTAPLVGTLTESPCVWGDRFTISTVEKSGNARLTKFNTLHVPDINAQFSLAHHKPSPLVLTLSPWPDVFPSSVSIETQL